MVKQNEKIIIEYNDNPNYKWFGDKPNIKITTSIIIKNGK